jgi:hypothetical protein
MVRITEMVHDAYYSRLYLTKVRVPQSNYHIKKSFISLNSEVLSMCPDWE